MHPHPPIVLEGDQAFVEQGVDVGRQHDAVVPLMRSVLSASRDGFDVVRDELSRALDAGHPAVGINQQHLLAEQALANARLRQLQALGFRYCGVCLDFVDVVEHVAAMRR